jgi:hypothetical protein
MKKKLNIDGVTNELRGGSAFFPSYKKQPPPADTPSHVSEEAPSKHPAPSTSPILKARVKQETSRDTVIPRHHDTTVSSHHDTMTPHQGKDIFEVVRRAVKQIGKEAATHRFTVDEKNHLADIEYMYKRQGIKTSENEITRIAINYFAEDYKEHGEKSLLAQILKCLNS